MVTVIGALGSMGRRYRAILKALKVDHFGVDVSHTEKQIYDRCSQSSHVIVATPTETHADILFKLSHLDCDILCEKPVTKDLKQLKRILKLFENRQFDMTLQYSMYEIPKINALSHYDYYMTGKDGLHWDCLQIIGLAEGEVFVRNNSPVWSCTINGEPLDRAYMDTAYIMYVAQFLKGHSIDREFLWKAHEKTYELSKQYS